MLSGPTRVKDQLVATGCGIKKWKGLFGGTQEGYQGPEVDAKWGEPSSVYTAGSSPALKPRVFQLLHLFEPCGGDQSPSRASRNLN